MTKSDRREADGTRFLNIHEVGRLLNADTTRTWAFLKGKEIPFRRIRHDRRFPLSSIMAAFYESEGGRL